LLALLKPTRGTTPTAQLRGLWLARKANVDGGSAAMHVTGAAWNKQATDGRAIIMLCHVKVQRRRPLE